MVDKREINQYREMTTDELYLKISDCFNENASISQPLGVGRKEKKNTKKEKIELFISNVQQVLRINNKEIKEKICVNLKLCEKINILKESYDDIQFLSAVIDSLASYFINFPVPVTLIAIYFLKKGTFNELCNCVSK